MFVFVTPNVAVTHYDAACNLLTTSYADVRSGAFQGMFDSTVTIAVPDAVPADVLEHCEALLAGGGKRPTICYY